MSDQWDSGEEEEEDGIEEKDEEKNVKQRVPATTKSPEGPWELVTTKKKYCVVLTYVRGVSVQLMRVCSDVLTYRHTLSQLTLSSNFWYGRRIS